MQVKFTKKITDYKYLVMFDLASRVSGVCLWDLIKNIPISTDKIIVSGELELPVAEQYLLIDQYFQKIQTKYNIKKEEILVSFEAAPSQIRSGNASTIQTFIALAKSHAILDYFLYSNDIATYDYVGVYPITTHAFFKQIMGLGKDDKVKKEDIREYLYKEYNLSNLSLDESDAIFLALTLVKSKWNKDIQEKIREKKRHKKTLKAPHAIKSVEEEIAFLNNIMN